MVTYSWDSDLDWADAKDAVDANAAALATDWLTGADTDGRPVHLVGYSVGARLSCEMLRTLADEDRTDVVTSVSLLGGAVPHDSVERGGWCGDGIAAVAVPVNNFHSRNDRVLGWVCRLSDRTPAVGYGGIRNAETTPEGYLDLDVTDLVDDHYSCF